MPISSKAKVGIKPQTIYELRDSGFKPCLQSRQVVHQYDLGRERLEWMNPQYQGAFQIHRPIHPLNAVHNRLTAFEHPLLPNDHPNMKRAISEGHLRLKGIKKQYKETVKLPCSYLNDFTTFEEYKNHITTEDFYPHLRKTSSTPHLRYPTLLSKRPATQAAY